jgi:hypothetical protein
MATAETFRKLAMGLEGTTEAPHFERTAYKVRRIYATLDRDKKSANFNFTPEEQEMKCTMYPDAFRAIDNGWGRSGWTTGVLAALTDEELEAALTMAWEHGRAKLARR